jgi:streptomycin 6-kinase
VLTDEAMLSERVREALRDLHPGSHIGDLRTLPGGHSGLTYEVAAGEHHYVVKAVPANQRPVGRNDVLRQAEVLRALAATEVPVPRVVASADLHPAWFAMTKASGEGVEPALDNHVLSDDVVRDRMINLTDIIRQLHSVDVTALDLTPQPSMGVVGELERWTRTLEAVPGELQAGGEELVRRLNKDVPDDGDRVLVHGDLRLGNVLCQGLDITAVIDWEIWGIGDPRIDLAWFLLFSDPANFPGVGRPVPGLPSEDELVRRYTGGGEPPDMGWFRALGRLKMAAIMGHNVKRHREGKHIDPTQERLPPTIAAMIRAGLELLS